MEDGFDGWIAVGWDLRKDPRTLRLARLLTASPATTMGHLVLLWTWAARHARDGVLSELDDEVVADAAEWPEDAGHFRRCLRTAGFLSDEEKLLLWDAIVGPWRWSEAQNQ